LQYNISSMATINHADLSHWPITTNFTQPGLRLIIHPENRHISAGFYMNPRTKKGGTGCKRRIG